MFTSVYVLFDWKGVQFCKPMVILMDDDDFDWRNDEEDDMMMMNDDDESTGNGNSVNEKQDWCREGVYSGLALLDAVLWMIVGGCLLYFLRSGRLDQAWNRSVSGHAEEDDEPTSSSTELEMGDVDDRRGGYTPATLATASESDTSLSLSSSVTAPLRTHEYQPL